MLYSIYAIHGSYGICSFQLIVGRLSPACPACHWCLSTWHCGAWCLRSCFMMPGPLGVRVLHLRLFRAGRCFLFGFLLFGVGWGFGLLLGAVDGQDSPRNPNILPSRVTFCGKLLDQYHGISWFSHQTFIFTSHIQVNLIHPHKRSMIWIQPQTNVTNGTHTHNKRTFLHVDLSTCPFEPPGNLMESDMGMTQLYV